jgi:hypothetical protein
MTAAEVINPFQTMKPLEIERRFGLIKEYEAEVRRRQAAALDGCADEQFKKIADQVFTENKELLQMLAERERKERETAPTGWWRVMISKSF